MKELIKKFLLENTQVEGRYIGGGDEPQIVVFPESEDWEREDFCNHIAQKLEDLILKPKKEVGLVDIKINTETLIKHIGKNIGATRKIDSRSEFVGKIDEVDSVRRRVKISGSYYYFVDFWDMWLIE